MKKLLTTILSLFAATSLFAGEYPDISVADLKKAIEEKKAVVIDVNGSESWKAAHVPTALDFQAVKADLKTKLPEDKKTLIVAYCGGPQCNAYTRAAKAAQELGYTNVKHLSAGLNGWKAAGEKTEAGEEKKGTSTEKGEAHTYVATFTGVSCGACEKKIGNAIASLPGGANAKWADGKAEGTKVVTFTSTNCGCETATKAALVAALGDNAKTFVVTELAKK